MTDTSRATANDLEYEDADAAEKRRADLKILVDDMHRVLSTKSGRRFVWRLLETAGVFRQSFTADPLVTAFNEGNRRYGLEVLALLTAHAPEKYLLMQSEHHVRSD